MTKPDDAQLDEALADALWPDADDTTLLSRAVLTQIAENSPSRYRPAAEVLVMPAPALGLMFAALLLCAAVGYVLPPPDLAETLVVQLLVGMGL